MTEGDWSHGGSMFLVHEKWNWNIQIQWDKWTSIFILNETARDPHSKCHTTGRTTYRDFTKSMKNDNGFHGEHRCGGDTVCTTERRVADGACDRGNCGEESMSLTSDGAVADRGGRREGHHFSVGGVKQARDISAWFWLRKLIWMTLLVISATYWKLLLLPTVCNIVRRDIRFLWLKTGSGTQYWHLRQCAHRWVTAYLWLQYCSHFPLQEKEI